MLSLRARFAKTADVSTSHLLPTLFDDFDSSDESIAVLDVGAGSPGTLDFFAQFRCRVFFLDLFDLEIAQPANDTVSEKHAFETFSSVLRDYHGTLFNICLFWDFLNRLDAAVMRGFSNALRPYLYSESKGYGVCHLLNDEQKKNTTYRLRDMTQLEVLPSQTATTNPWSHSEFTEQFDCFRIVQDNVSTQGRLEFLMEAD